MIEVSQPSGLLRGAFTMRMKHGGKRKLTVAILAHSSPWPGEVSTARLAISDGYGSISMDSGP